MFLSFVIMLFIEFSILLVRIVIFCCVGVWVVVVVFVFLILLNLVVNGINNIFVNMSFLWIRWGVFVVIEDICFSKWIWWWKKKILYSY